MLADCDDLILDATLSKGQVTSFWAEIDWTVKSTLGFIDATIAMFLKQNAIATTNA